MCNKFYCEFKKFVLGGCDGCFGGNATTLINESEEARINRISSELISVGFNKTDIEFVLGR